MDLKPLERILLDAKSIAVVGLSRDPSKDSQSVAAYLQEHGYKIIPVNPSSDEILGEKVFHSVSEIKEPVDIVDIFRPSEECGQIVKEAVKLRPKMVWLQLGIESGEAKKIAERSGIVFVQNKCIRTEHRRLAGL
ncbi:MAG: CoA-binding protein [Candidatus Diapherotrites archaeon]|nr:CoA-binding protein [Candidatus Diapherotrites archaeon]